MVVAIGVVVLDVAAGTLLRLLRDRGSSLPSYVEPSERFHHALAASVETEQRWGHRRVAIVTNSLGMRDAATRTVARDVSSPVRRLLVLGDSFAEGVGVDFEMTFVGRIAVALAPSVEVLNGGVSSYSPAVHRCRLEALLEPGGPDFHETVLYLDVSDPIDDLGYRPGRGDDGSCFVAFEPPRLDRRGYFLHEDRRMPPVRFVSHNTVLARRVLGRLLPHINHQPPAVNMLRSMWSIDGDLFEDFGDRGLVRTLAHLDAIQAMLAEREVPLRLAIYPWPDHLARRALSNRYRDAVRHWCDTRGVDLIDHFESFEREDHDPDEVIERLFIRGDVHWNEAGHERIAGEFLDRYRE